LFGKALRNGDFIEEIDRFSLLPGDFPQYFDRLSVILTFLMSLRPGNIFAFVTYSTLIGVLIKFRGARFGYYFES
jgi:hypothetical protein